MRCKLAAPQYHHRFISMLGSRNKSRRVAGRVFHDMMTQTGASVNKIDITEHYAYRYILFHLMALTRVQGYLLRAHCIWRRHILRTHAHWNTHREKIAGSSQSIFLDGRRDERWPGTMQARDADERTDRPDGRTDSEWSGPTVVYYT